MTNYDVIVVGGGAAGLSAGVTLGRARRTVLVIDAGHPRNAPAAGVHNFLSRDGVPPSDLLAAGRDEVRRYGGEIVAATATGAVRTDNGFTVSRDDGRTHGARRLVVAGGLVDELPDVSGLREQWGRGVVHCPYCHGWEVRDQAIGVVGSGPRAVHQALLFRQWTSDLVLFLHTAPEPGADDLEKLTARGVEVVRGRIARVSSEDGRLTGVVLEDGTHHARDAVVAGPRMVASSAVLDALGVGSAPHPMGAAVGESYPADPTGRTAVPGVWVAGNITDLAAQVVTAAAQGVTTGAFVNASLIEDETAAAVAEHRRQTPVARFEGMATVRANRVPVPDAVLDSPEARKADYRVAVRIESDVTLTPEQWARGCFEGAPAVFRGLLVLGWRLAFRLRLGPRRSSTTVLGWFVTDSGPDSATLSAGSPLIESQQVFVRDGGGLVWVTLVRSHTRLGRILWRLVAPGHELSMPLLLRHAARTAA